MTGQPASPFKPSRDGFRWDGVPVLEYKDDGKGTFLGVTRQVLVEGQKGLGCQLRYFEIAPGGHSTLERHAHAHGVVILRGRGRAMVAGEVRPVRPFDVVCVPPMAWHQFRADTDAPLGFLCAVDCDRDRPQLPSAEEAAAFEALWRTGAGPG